MLDRWKYTMLLAALLALMVVHPVLFTGEEFAEFVYFAFATAVFFGACIVLFEKRRLRTVAFVLGLPTLVSLVTRRIVHPELHGVLGTAADVFPVLFLAYVAAVILRAIFRDRDVSGDSINGAFCVYLLIALAFSHLYGLVASHQAHSFQLQDHLGAFPPAGARRQSLLTYFSLITLTTVGYGDILPRSPAARMLAVTEAVFGQFYVAVVVAQLISLKVTAAQPARDDGSA